MVFKSNFVNRYMFNFFPSLAFEGFESGFVNTHVWVDIWKKSCLLKHIMCHKPGIGFVTNVKLQQKE
jgi:hypothetical protein